VTIGIYAIRNLVNEKQYIGSSVNIEKRWKDHIRQLRHHKHDNRHLQRAWDKYSEAAFQIEVLIETTKDRLLWWEQWCLDYLSPAYNIAPHAASVLGIKHTPEVCAQISARMIGNTCARGHRLSIKDKAKISAVHKGKTLTDEHKAKLLEANKGNQYSLGYRHTAEAKTRIRAAQIGRKRGSPTAEHRAKLSITQRIVQQRKRASAS